MARGELTIRSLTLPPFNPRPKECYLIEEEDIQSIQLLGDSTPLKWKLTTEGLKMTMPENPPCEHAYTIKIQWNP